MKFELTKKYGYMLTTESNNKIKKLNDSKLKRLSIQYKHKCKALLIVKRTVYSLLNVEQKETINHRYRLVYTVYYAMLQEIYLRKNKI